MNNSPAEPPLTPKPKKTIWAWTIATFFGVGFWKPGPGTAGSIVAAAMWLFAGHLVWTTPTVTSFVTTAQLAWITAAAALILLAVAIPASTIVARESGRKDPQFVVADEAVGQWITLIASPARWEYALIGLVLFRAFDIWKPAPIRKIEDLPEGWGIMLDDVAAGVYALICLQIIHHWLR